MRIIALAKEKINQTEWVSKNIVFLSLVAVMVHMQGSPAAYLIQKKC